MCAVLSDNYYRMHCSLSSYIHIWAQALYCVQYTECKNINHLMQMVQTNNEAKKNR